MKIIKKSTENCHFYSRKKLQYIACVCFRNETKVLLTGHIDKYSISLFGEAYNKMMMEYHILSLTSHAKLWRYLKSNQQNQVKGQGIKHYTE